MTAQAQSQPVYTVVYDLYYKLTVYPKRGDQLIQNNLTIFDQQFYSCLSQVESKLSQASANHLAYCATLPHPQQWNCEKQDEAGKFLFWTKTVRAVIQGQFAWSQTTIGQAAILSKQQLGAQNYESLVAGTIPKYRPWLVCP
jgi:hypothetical protein